jgi:hypothetical protein
MLLVLQQAKYLQFFAAITTGLETVLSDFCTFHMRHLVSGDNNGSVIDRWKRRI